MTTLAIDPGNTTGVALIGNNGELLAETQLPHGEFIEFLAGGALTHGGLWNLGMRHVAPQELQADRDSLEARNTQLENWPCLTIRAIEERKHND